MLGARSRTQHPSFFSPSEPSSHCCALGAAVHGKRPFSAFPKSIDLGSSASARGCPVRTHADAVCTCQGGLGGEILHPAPLISPRPLRPKPLGAAVRGRARPYAESGRYLGDSALARGCPVRNRAGSACTCQGAGWGRDLAPSNPHLPSPPAPPSQWAQPCAERPLSAFPRSMTSGIQRLPAAALYAIVPKCGGRLIVALGEP